VEHKADLVRDVAAELLDKRTYANEDNDIVDGSLEETVAAVLVVLERRGMLKEPTGSRSKRTPGIGRP
jgi:hypothetical protein